MAVPVGRFRTPIFAGPPNPLTKEEGATSPPPHGLTPSTMFSALLLRPLELVFSVSLAAFAVSARQDILCQSARI